MSVNNCSHFSHSLFSYRSQAHSTEFIHVETPTSLSTKRQKRILVRISMYDMICKHLKAASSLDREHSSMSVEKRFANGDIVSKHVYQMHLVIRVLWICLPKIDNMGHYYHGNKHFIDCLFHYDVTKSSYAQNIAGLA